MRMTWLLTWLDVSIATLNVTLQLLVIYRLAKNCWKPYHNFFLIGLGVTCDHLEVIVPSKSTLLPKNLDGTPHSPQRTQSVLHKQGVALYPKLSRDGLGYSGKIACL